MLSVPGHRRRRPASPAESLIGDADMSATARMVEIIDQFVAHVGITPATSDPLNGIEARWEMLRDGGVERPGLAFAAWMDLGLVGGVVPPLLANCRDVGALLESLARYHPLWGDDEVVVDINRSGWAAVSLRAPVGAVVHRDTLDAFLAVLARTFGQLTNPPRWRSVMRIGNGAFVRRSAVLSADRRTLRTSPLAWRTVRARCNNDCLNKARAMRCCSTTNDACTPLAFCPTAPLP